MKTQENLWRDTRGDAVVEATILFPIIMMIFAGLVLLAVYLPTRSVLQYATQTAATAIATERSDTWLRYDPDTMQYDWLNSRRELGNVYSALIGGLIGNNRNDSRNAEKIVLNLEQNGGFQPIGEVTVEYGVVNYIVYKEIIVTATKTIESPVDLSFVGFPKEIPITVTSTAVVQNGDEFIRNLDLAKEITLYFSEELGLDKIFDGIGKICDKFNNFLGI